MPRITADEGIGPALSRTGLMLFRPFRWKAWFALALPAALTLVGDVSLSSANFNYSSGRGGPGPAAQFAEMMEFLRKYLPIILSVGIALILLFLAIYLLARWLNSRGQFIFFDNVVNHHYQIAAPWAQFRELGNSLFKFRIGLDLIVFNIFLLIAAISLAIAGRDLYQAAVVGQFTFTPLIITAIAVFILASLLFLIVRWIASSILFHMAMPVMYLRRMHAWPAFKLTCRELFLPNIGACMLYFLVMIVARIIQMVWTIIGIFAFCLVTLCLGYLALILPIVSNYPIALMTLPVLVFKRAYKLQFISQFGNEYRVTWRVDNDTGGGFPVILNTPAPAGQIPESPGPNAP